MSETINPTPIDPYQQRLTSFAHAIGVGVMGPHEVPDHPQQYITSDGRETWYREIDPKVLPRLPRSIPFHFRAEVLRSLGYHPTYWVEWMGDDFSALIGVVETSPRFGIWLLMSLSVKDQRQRGVFAHKRRQ